MKKKKKKKKKFFLDAVGWKPYCSRLGRRALGAGALGWALGRWAWALGRWAGRWLGVQARRQQALGRAARRGRARTGEQGARTRADRRGRQGTDARGRADGRWRAGQASGTARRGRSARQAGRGRARRAAWARGARGLGVPGRAWCTGWASLRLMQPVWVLIWVFDSVVFLSHRLDSVHEHCSLQKKNFQKKNNIY